MATNGGERGGLITTTSKSEASAVTLPPGFRSTFLAGLTPPEIEAVLAAARQEKIFSDRLLLQQGEPATRLWLLVTGRVAVYRLAHEGGKLFLHWGVPGDVFGKATILRKPTRYLVTVEVVQDGCLLAWDLPTLRVLASQCPNLTEAVTSVAADFVDCLIDMLTARAFQTAQQRLARMLVESARQLGRTGPEGIQLDLTNEQLALTAHLSLFTATRQLSKWQDLGILKKHRGMIVLRSLSVFERIAKGS